MQLGFSVTVSSCLRVIREPPHVITEMVLATEEDRIVSQTKMITKRSAKRTTKSEATKDRVTSSGKDRPANGAAVAKETRKGSKRQRNQESPVASQTKPQEAASQESNTTTKDTEKLPEVGHPSEPHSQTAEYVVTVDRRRLPDRRSGEDRRQQNIPVPVERRKLDRRAKVPRRRQIDPTTCERDYTPDEIEFMIALDEYKRSSGRMFPTCSEILEVIKKLGYEKRPKPAVDAQDNIPAENHEDATPSPEATSPSEPSPPAADAPGCQAMSGGITAVSEAATSTPPSPTMPLSSVQ